MSNQQQTLTPEQAHAVLTELGNLEQLKLNKREHIAVEAALAVIKQLVDAAKAAAVPTVVE